MVRLPSMRIRDFAMQKTIATGVLCLTSLLSVANAHACERLQPEANGDDRTRHVALSAAMSDERILQSLRLNAGRGEVERKESGDTVSVRYTYFHRVVTIVRSASKGVQVEMLEKDRKALVWKLGTC